MIIKEVFAQTPISNPALEPKLQQLTGAQFVGKFISSLIGLFLIVGGIAAFFLLLLGGLQFMLSGGDKAGTEAAKSRITTALIGLILLFATWAIVLLIEKFLGITILGGPFKVPVITPP